MTRAFLIVCMMPLNLCSAILKFIISKIFIYIKIILYLQGKYQDPPMDNYNLTCLSMGLLITFYGTDFSNIIHDQIMQLRPKGFYLVVITRWMDAVG